MEDHTLVVGSIAFDHVFSIEPSFKQELPIINGELNKVNMTFVATSDTIIISGGTGSNISYSHALLSDRVYMFSAVGHDFKGTMGRSLSDMGVKDRTVVFDRDTARSLQITDKHGEQMIVWQPNAYEKINDIDLSMTLSTDEIKSCNRAIFSPGTPISTIRHIKNYRKYNPTGEILFDPGQMINFYTPDQFMWCLDQANYLMVNEVELNKVEKAFNLTDEEILIKHDVDFIIVTFGSDGSKIISKGKETKIPVYSDGITVDTEIEATGAGDAYRGAMLGALTLGYDLETACKYGSVISGLCVRFNGGQLHNITFESAKEKVAKL